MSGNEIVQIGPDDKILSPLLDPIFKALFTSETAESREALKDFISTYIGKKVKEVRIVGNEPAVFMVDDKQIRYDVNCVFDNGEKCNVEMTVFPSLHEHLRIEYYVSRLFVSQKTKGNRDWGKLKEAYQISIIVNDKIFKDESLIHGFEYYDRKNNISLNGKTHIITVELSKLKSEREEDLEKLTGKELWAMFFKYAEKIDKRELVNEIVRTDRGISMATQELLRISKDDEMQLRAISEEKRLTDYDMDMNSWISWGREEGLREGIEKSKREIAENMRRQGFTDKQIKSVLGIEI